MNTNLIALTQIAQKSERNIVGLMSGTSLDGLDVAYCTIAGHGTNSKVRLVHFETISYAEDVKSEIRKVFAQKTIDFQQLAVLHEYVGILHGTMVLQCLSKWQVATSEVDLIASHGQTVFHAPKAMHGLTKFPNATLQIGDGDHVAVTTNCITVSDFRQKHLAVGGEGAPLAVYGDYFLFSTTAENRILLNIGGISNFTFLPDSGHFDAVFVTDTGTGNTLMDAFTRLHFPDLAYDKDAALAKSGKINIPLLQALKSHPFFEAPFPKSTGPEMFPLDYLYACLEATANTTLAVEDVLATLNRFTAETIADAIIKVSNENFCTPENLIIYVSGGGVHNSLLMEHLEALLLFPVKTTEELGIDSDAKEALLFALLANETIVGNNTTERVNPHIPYASFGKISFPK
jgi:anhydro-N-acetylmuramic acid kinase